MALGKCRECGREVSKSAKVCPGCGVTSPIGGWTTGAKVGAFALLLVPAWLWLHDADKPAISPLVMPTAAALAASNTPALTPFSGLDDIKKKVAADAVAQYGIAKRGGAKMDICAHAGMVAAAFLQAKDEAGYRQWKATEATDCASAGLPGQ